MEDMINKIIEIDKQAQDMTAGALAEKQKAEAGISITAKKIREEYLEKANKEIAILEKNELALADEALLKKDIKNKQLLENLNAYFEKNEAIWIEQLTERILK